MTDDFQMLFPISYHLSNELTYLDVYGDEYDMKV